MAGTNNSWNNQVTAAYNNIVLNAQTNDIDIGTDTSTSIINIGTGTGAKSINIGFGVANKGIIIGVANGTTSVDIESGSGGVTVNSVGGTASLTGSAGTSVDSAGDISVGTSAASQNVFLGTGAGVKTVTLGSTHTSSATNIQSGSGNINIPAFTEGALITSSAGALSTVTGTAGFVLTANAPGTAPSFQAAGGGGGGITTINGDTGSVTGATISIVGGGSSGAGSSVSFSGSGTTMSFNVTDSQTCTFIGKGTGTAIGTNNVGLGASVMPSVTNSNNIGIGNQVLLSLVGSGNGNNIGIGGASLLQLSDGKRNIAIGFLSGFNYASTESDNILFNNGGTVSENNTLRIGSATGTGSTQLNAAFIAGIQGITVTGTAVLVSSSDQLGIAVSSARFKENIQDMGSVSSNILKLRPVIFNYKVGEDHSQQTGLIAEEVAEIMPALVVYDKDSLPQSIKYHDLPALLLNELQKALKRIEVLEAKIKD